MSVQFAGWEVLYDDDSPRAELGSAQEPEDRGVYAMYHGTTVAHTRLILANGFQPSSGGMLGKGVYVSRDKTKAQRYPLNSKFGDRVVLELRVRVGRVKRIDRDNHPLQYTWNAQGYHTAWVPPNCGMKSVPSGLEEDCVFDPARVKVARIAMAADAVRSELEKLLADSLRNSGVQAGDGNPASEEDVCSQCKKKQQQGLQHARQPCWGCGQIICPLMIKHVCTASV